MSTSWSTIERVQYLLTLPWTVAIEVTREGEVIARIQEIPRATVRGRSNTQVAQQLWSSLRIALEDLVAANQDVPLPDGVQLPWLPDTDSRTRTRSARGPAGVARRGAAKNRQATAVSRVVRLWSGDADWRNR